ncbi:hypothetical protein EYF80_034584 [Liparis tanakae]|uniref:Uncharacterized protein n=1 Tax=Liparis tanakae TaxID=230148 RepID=A0A4Z2GPL1_9TELE|nr:hypothetical protein EYF80_034584 [Liparis tanakae]
MNQRKAAPAEIREHPLWRGSLSSPAADLRSVRTDAEVKRYRLHAMAALLRRLLQPGFGPHSDRPDALLDALVLHGARRAEKGVHRGAALPLRAVRTDGPERLLVFFTFRFSASDLRLLFELAEVALVDLELVHFAHLQNPRAGHDAFAVAGRSLRRTVMDRPVAPRRTVAHDVRGGQKIPGHCQLTEAFSIIYPLQYTSN